MLTTWCTFLEVDEDDAVNTMLAVAAGDVDHPALAHWLTERMKPIQTSD